MVLGQCFDKLIGLLELVRVEFFKHLDDVIFRIYTIPLVEFYTPRVAGDFNVGLHAFVVLVAGARHNNGGWDTKGQRATNERSASIMAADNIIELIDIIMPLSADEICVDDLSVQAGIPGCEFDIVIQLLCRRYREQTAILGLVVSIFVDNLLRVVNNGYRDVVRCLLGVQINTLTGDVGFLELSQIRVTQRSETHETEHITGAFEVLMVGCELMLVELLEFLKRQVSDILLRDGQMQLVVYGTVLDRIAVGLHPS